MPIYASDNKPLLLEHPPADSCHRSSALVGMQALGESLRGVQLLATLPAQSRFTSANFK